MSLLKQDLFAPTCCNPCLLKPFTVKPGKLSKCLGCRLILYCSSAHQKLDWRIHRSFCQAASAILARYKAEHLFTIDGPIKTQEELNITTLKVKYMLRSLLKRKLSYHEEELTSFPVICNVCYSTKMSKLYQCKHCNAVSYCCEEHEQQDAPIHQAECLQLKIYYCKFKIKTEMILKLTLRERCNLFDSNITSAMKTMFGIEYAPDPSERLTEYQRFSLVSDFSCIATVAYIMSHLQMDRYRGDQFTLYVGGATNDEIWFTPTHVQFLFACYPQIFRLNLVFVGPEVFNGTSKPVTLDLGDGRSLYRASYKRTLEDYFLETEDHLKPNIVACFNCGFSENTHNSSDGPPDLWHKALRYLTELPEVPLLFTSYTSLEADFDFGTLMRVVDDRKDFSNVRMERIIAKQQNPYRDLRPLRSWQFNDPERIYYRNGYVQAVRIKLNDY